MRKIYRTSGLKHNKPPVFTVQNDSSVPESMLGQESSRLRERCVQVPELVHEENARRPA